jgi:phage terminase small subunit
MKQAIKLTRKQKAFADKIIADTKISATEAAAQSYNVTNRPAAAAIASENLRKPQIQAYLDIHAQKASSAVMELMDTSLEHRDDASHASVALRAAQDVLDRTYGKAVQQVETKSTSVTLSIDLSGKDDVVVQD